MTPFIAAGEVDAGGRLFQVRHLYGLRPFASDTAMRTLRSNLMQRVTPLVRNRVPYCELNGVTSELCMSCMGFVSQVLFPGRTPEYAAFPRNFPHIAGEYYHTTEDLLLYLTGLHALRTDAARKRRMAAIGGPAALQEELARLTAIMAKGLPLVERRHELVAELLVGRDALFRMIRDQGHEPFAAFVGVAVAKTLHGKAITQESILRILRKARLQG